MHNEYLFDLQESEIKVGKIKLESQSGRTITRKALFIPDYGWVPCAKKLLDNFTTIPSELVIVFIDPTDDNYDNLSNIWVSRTRPTDDLEFDW